MSPEPGRVLALDLGEVRIGLALSDALGITAQPLQALQRTSLRRDLRALCELIEERGVTRTVIGLPLLLSGEEGTAALAAREFAGKLGARIGADRIDMWDERLTTVEAERTLIAADVSRRRRKEVVDSMAAALILQNYLEGREMQPGPAR